MDDASKALKNLLNAAPTTLTCMVMHHGKKDLHEAGEDCPPLIKYLKARKEAEQVLENLSEWQPIETAPKDCAFLGYMRFSNDTWMITPMYWAVNEFVCLEFYSDNTEHSVQPTHWQPLPPPPKG